MGIGTSIGAYYDDDFHHATAQWDDKYDDNVVTPFQMQQNQQLNQVEQTELGGTEVGLKIAPPNNTMPFPDNRNPDTDFNSRFPRDMKSGILNDIKPQDPVPSLLRRISDVEDDESWKDFSNVGNTPIPDLPLKKDDPSVGGYMNWLDKNKLKDTDRYDYDMQGAYQAGVQPSDDNGHLPDTFKKPNHPTFSDESIYHRGNLKFPDSEEAPEGGHWDKNDDGSYNFTPGRSNFDYHSPQELIDYFKKYEPKNHLILPGQ